VIRDALDEKLGVRNLSDFWVVHARIVNPNQRQIVCVCSFAFKRNLCAYSVSLVGHARIVNPNQRPTRAVFQYVYTYIRMYV
jgi:hypothetical protein